MTSGISSSAFISLISLRRGAATNSKFFSSSSSSSSSSLSSSSPVQHIPSEKILLGAAKSTSKSIWSEEDHRRLGLKDYFDQCRELIGRSDGGPPRWLSPLETASNPPDSPLLLYLPGVDGLGLGIIMHHQRLGKIFDIWCLHVPMADRTSFTELVKMVVSTIKIENLRAPHSPIYLVGESLGSCIALAVAARNPDIDLILILANPATSFSRSQMQPQTLIPLSLVMPEQLRSSLPYVLCLLSGVPLKMAAGIIEKRLPLEQVIEEICNDTTAMSSYLAALSGILTEDTLLWKLQLLKSAEGYTNSRLRAVKAQTLILASGQGQLLPSIEEAERLRRILPKCEIRIFDACGHALFLEHGVSLISILIGASIYRRGRHHDHVSDYTLPCPSEFEKIYESQRWFISLTDPVMLSTVESGKIVRGLEGIPSVGPVLYVGYHTLLGLELISLVASFWMQKDILLRGVAHPMAFTKLREGKMPAIVAFDTFRILGAVPVSAANFYKLLSSKSHVLLYPGGVREALHRKGEEYKLFWPEQSEFVRMAVKFGAKIVPFGTVGEDDIGELIIDYNDQMQIPYFKNVIEELTVEIVRLRVDAVGEVANQDVHLPIIRPKIPGRFYYFFGKPIDTAGRKHELQSRQNSHQLYLQVK